MAGPGNREIGEEMVEKIKALKEGISAQAKAQEE